MGGQRRFAALVAGILGTGLAGCMPVGATYEPERIHGEPILLRAPLYRVAGGAGLGASGTLAIVDFPVYTKWPGSTSRSDTFEVRTRLRSMTPLETYYVEQEGSLAIAVSVPTDLQGNGHGAADLTYGVPYPGTRVVVKDSGGQVVMAGAIPFPDAEGLQSTEYEHPGGVLRLTVNRLCSPTSGRESLAFRLSGLPPDWDGELFIRPINGSFAPAGSIALEGQGRGSIVWSSRTGNPLPAGADSVRSMGGWPFEIRLQGDVVFAGLVP